MQKNNNASILLWSILLSMILGVSFVSLSLQIRNNLEQNQDIINKNTKNIEENTNIVKEENYIIPLRKEEEIEITASGEINITANGGMVIYSTGEIENLLNGTKSFQNTDSIKLKNFGGFSKLEIIGDFKEKKQKYKIYKKIGNKIIEKTSGEIKNF